MSHVERTSKYTKLAKLPDKTQLVVQACARVLLPLATKSNNHLHNKNPSHPKSNSYHYLFNLSL